MAATTLLPWNSNWLYFDFGYEPHPSWAQPGYDDNDWPLGTAQFGYGDGDETTILSYGTDDENKYVTTYFRTYVEIENPAQYDNITLNLIRDDGVIVYVNGVAVARDNLPTEDVYYDSYALRGLTFPEEGQVFSVALSPSLFVDGPNLIAVEIHQYEAASPDLSFDLQLVGNSGGAGGIVIRGPYLQVGTSSNIVVRWRTDVSTTTGVRYGTNPGNLEFTVSSAAFVADHEITLTNLAPDMKYFYDIGTAVQPLAGDASYHFTTAPVPGTPKPTRIWAIGDFGTGFTAQHDVRNAYVNFTGARRTDVWLMLGDNAYYSGLDHEYQWYCFDIYPTQFRQWVAWPTVGNHETAGDQSLNDDFDYYRIFTMPTMGQAGGVASGTEHYYSYDYANIHFVCLDSMTASFRQTNGAMAQWLAADLADTTRDWIIAYFHHPPYTRGSHNSDFEIEHIEMRENIIPILEAYGVDLVLGGHSHSYERSFFLNGHYGYSSTINSGNFINSGNGRTNGTGAYLKPGGGLGANGGTVYVVDGSSGGQYGGGALNHPAMYYSTLTYGSLVIDITGQRLDATFVTANGSIGDTFTILKEGFPGAPRPEMQMTRAGTNAVITWPTSVPDYQLETKTVIDAEQWTAAGASMVTNGRRKSVTVPTAPGTKFFQLRRVP